MSNSWSPPAPSSAVKFFRIMLLATAYYVSGRWGLTLHSYNGFAAPIWFPTALSLCALFMGGRYLWPGIALGAFILNLSMGASLFLAMTFALGNTLEAIAGNYLLRLFNFRPNLDRVRDIFSLSVWGGMVSTYISASIGSLALYATQPQSLSSFFLTWKVWWMGDMLSNLVAAPFLFVWASHREKLRWSWRVFLETFILTGTLIALTHFVFGRSFNPYYYGKAPLPYLLFPPLIWASLRFGVRGAATATFLTSILAISHTLSGAGPFGQYAPEEHLFSLQLFMGVMSITSLVFAALGAERAESREALHRSHEELEKNVEARTRELRTANALLKDSEERFRLLVSSIEDYAIFGLDPEGYVVTWNSGAERLKGYQAAQILGQHFSRFYTPEDIASDRPREFLSRAVADGHVRAEGWRVRRDGSTFFADVLISALKDRNGDLKGFVKVVRDVTERRRLDEELRRGREMLSEAQRMAHIGSWEWDVEANTMSWSDEMYRIFGKTPDNFKPTFAHVYHYYHPEDRDLIQNTMRKAIETKEPFSIDFRIILNGSNVRYLHGYGKVITDESGKIRRMLGTAQDMTDQRKTTEQFLELEKALQKQSGEEIARIAHSLVGANAMVGMTRLVGPLRQLEGAGEKQDIGSARHIFEALSAEFKTIHALLQKAVTSLT